MVARFKRTRKGDYRVVLVGSERDLLGEVPALLGDLMDEGDMADAALRRLFPPATMDDRERDAAFERSLFEDLSAQRRETLAVLARTIEAERITEEDLEAWLRACNDARLVLGVRLNVSEDDDPTEVSGDPARARMYGVYRFLSFLVDQMVTALSGPSNEDLSRDVWRREREERD